MNSAEKGESASENLQLSSHFQTEEELTMFVLLSHSCIAAVNSIPSENRNGRGFATAFTCIHIQDSFSPQSSRIHSKKWNDSKFLSQIEVLCWFHTTLTFHFLFYQSFWVWLLDFFFCCCCWFFLPPIHLKSFLEKIHLALVHAHAFLVIHIHAHSDWTLVRTNGQRT